MRPNTSANSLRRRARPTPRAPARMPALQQPHAHHRDFRARMPAEVPAHAASGGNQDRHVIMTSPSIHHDSYARHSCCFSTDITQARLGALHSIAVARPILSRYPKIVRPHQPMRPWVAASQSRRALHSNLGKPQPPANPHSVPGTAPAHLPRFRALALFGRRPQERVYSLVIPAPKNMHNSANHAAWLSGRLTVGLPKPSRPSVLPKN
jgi:hypothetical protein